MKLRIRGDTLRLRLKRGEVERIAAGQRVEEQTHFPGATLHCTLEPAAVAETQADFVSDRIVVRIPHRRVGEWARSDQVSLAAHQQLADGATLSVLVEKDFACLAPGRHREHEDDTDTYPHPDAGKNVSC